MCEDLTLEEQVQTFSEAEVVLGPHGAGLTNMLYEPKGSKVTEMYGVEFSPCFAAMARQLSLEYGRLATQAGIGPRGFPAMTVDLAEFSRWLEGMVAAGASSSETL